MAKSDAERRKAAKKKADQRVRDGLNLLYFCGWLPSETFEAYENGASLETGYAAAKERGELLGLTFQVRTDKLRQLSPGDTVTIADLLSAE